MVRVLDQFRETFRETPPPFALPLAIGSCRSQIELHCAFGTDHQEPRHSKSLQVFEFYSLDTAKFDRHTKFSAW